MSQNDKETLYIIKAALYLIKISSFWKMGGVMSREDKETLYFRKAALYLINELKLHQKDIKYPYVGPAFFYIKENRAFLLERQKVQEIFCKIVNETDENDHPSNYFKTYYPNFKMFLESWCVPGGDPKFKLVPSTDFKPVFWSYEIHSFICFENTPGGKSPKMFEKLLPNQIVYPDKILSPKYKKKLTYDYHFDEITVDLELCWNRKTGVREISIDLDKDLKKVLNQVISLSLKFTSDVIDIIVNYIVLKYINNQTSNYLEY